MSTQNAIAQKLQQLQDQINIKRKNNINQQNKQNINKPLKAPAKEVRLNKTTQKSQQKIHQIDYGKLQNFMSIDDLNMQSQIQSLRSDEFKTQVSLTTMKFERELTQTRTSVLSQILLSQDIKLNNTQVRSEVINLTAVGK